MLLIPYFASERGFTKPESLNSTKKVHILSQLVQEECLPCYNLLVISLGNYVM